MSHPPVDVVITWVDGHDPVHLQKRLARLNASQEAYLPAIEPTRFNQCGEIEWCVRSWLRFAPWVRTLYIVTDAQEPPILKILAPTLEPHRLQLIDHQVLFKGIETALPTFNSLSIESMLWQIPGLSEHFIYCNDDCFLIRPVVYSDFFHASKVVTRGRWKTQHHVQSRKKLKRFTQQKRAETVSLHRLIQENSATLAGYTQQFFHLPHMPFAVKKSVFLQDKAYWHANAMFPFRDPQQSSPMTWAYHEMIRQQQCYYDHHLKAVTLNGETYTLLRICKRLLRATCDPRVVFMCMQSLDQASERVRSIVFAWLARMI